LKGKLNLKFEVFYIFWSIYNNAVHSVICAGLTHMWKALAWSHHFTTREGCGHKTSLTHHLFINVPVPSQESERSCVCVRSIESTILLLYFGNGVYFCLKKSSDILWWTVMQHFCTCFLRMSENAFNMPNKWNIECCSSIDI
jgi:hypothetical protein